MFKRIKKFFYNSFDEPLMKMATRMYLTLARYKKRKQYRMAHCAMRNTARILNYCDNHVLTA